MSFDIDDKELASELEKYGEMAPKINDKNRAICMKKLNHFRAREAMAAREADQTKRRSTGRSPGRQSIGRIPNEQTLSNGVNIPTEERNLRRRTIAVSTDLTPPKNRPTSTTMDSMTPTSIPTEPISLPTSNKTPPSNYISDPSITDKYLSSTPIIDRSRHEISSHGIGSTRQAWDASDSEGEPPISTTYRARLTPNIKTYSSSYGNFGSKHVGQNSKIIDNKEWQSQKHWWSLSPYMVVLGVAILFVVIGFIYLFTISPVKPFLIEGDLSASMILEEVIGEMARKNGDIICNNQDPIKMWYSIDDVKSIITRIGGIENNVTNIFNALVANSKNIISFGDKDYKSVKAIDSAHLKLKEAHLSLLCRVHRALISITWKIALAIISVLLLLLFLIVLWVMHQRLQKHKRSVQNMVNEIISLVRNNDELSRRDTSVKPFVSMMQVRDSLIPITKGENMKDIWNGAVTWLLDNEPRLKPCRELVDDQQIEAWRWVEPKLSYTTSVSRIDSTSTIKDRKIAGPNLDIGEIKVIQSCLKLYNIISPDSLYVSTDTRDAILDKCGAYHGILHMGIDPTMEKGVIYVKCISDLAAGQNYKLLHAWTFKDKLVSVQYFSPTAYRMMFPESDENMTTLRSTNQAKRRLSGSRN